MEWRTERPVNSADARAIDRVRDRKVGDKASLEKTSEEQTMLTGIVSGPGLVLLPSVGAANKRFARVFVPAFRCVNGRAFIRRGM